MTKRPLSSFPNAAVNEMYYYLCVLSGFLAGAFVSGFMFAEISDGRSRFYVGVYGENFHAFSDLKCAKKAVDSWLIDSSVQDTGYIFAFLSPYFVNTFFYCSDRDYFSISDLLMKSDYHYERRSAASDWHRVG